jgi:hypothetical protein
MQVRCNVHLHTLWTPVRVQCFVRESVMHTNNCVSICYVYIIRTDASFKAFVKLL